MVAFRNVSLFRRSAQRADDMMLFLLLFDDKRNEGVTCVCGCLKRAKHPRIYIEVFRSGGATTVIFMGEGASAIKYFGECSPALERGRATCRRDVHVQVIAGVDVALYDALEIRVRMLSCKRKEGR